MRNKWMDFVVGLFILLGMLALVVMAIKVSGLSASLGKNQVYQVSAQFENIGGLKVRAPIAVSGVVVGRVSHIALDPKTFQASVTLDLYDQYQRFPRDTVASILTQGLLGANYISLTPGFDDALLKPNDRIQTTHSAIVLENLIGQMMYAFKSGGKSASKPVATPLNAKKG